MRLILSVVLAFTFFHPIATQAAESKGEESTAISTIQRERSTTSVALYRQNCQACHGQEGKGKGPAITGFTNQVPDFTSPQALVKYSKEKMTSFLKTTHETDTSGEWKDTLSTSEIRDIINFIHEAFMLPVATADASVGRKIFARTCSVCHGDRGNSSSWAKNSLNPSPFDFTSFKAKKLTRRHMINTVTYGSDGTAMVGWSTQLSREEVVAVVDYIRATFVFPNKQEKISKSGINEEKSLSSDKNATVAAVGKLDLSRPFEHGLKGNLEKGKTLFETNCAPCHGKAGNGDGPRAYFIFPRPENFTGKRARSELNRPQLLQSISEGIVGTVMPAWARVLKIQELTDVSEYVFKTFIMAEASDGKSKLLTVNDKAKVEKKK